MNTLKQIARDITSYIGEGDYKVNDQEARRLRVLRALIVDLDGEEQKCGFWNTLNTHDMDDIETIMMDEVDEICWDLYGDFYEQD